VTEEEERINLLKKEIWKKILRRFSLGWPQFLTVRRILTVNVLSVLEI
jgi:hypothetical protein